MSAKAQRVGVALSGGGYRAAAFHLGTLHKLQQLGVLEKVDVLSTISGGSITGAAWCLYKGEYEGFHEEMKVKLETKGVIRKVLLSWECIRTVLLLLLFVVGSIFLSFTSYAPFSLVALVLFIVILYLFQFRIFPVSQVIERVYDEYFFNKKTLKDLKPKPVIAIGSSNLHTGRPFTFSQNKMSDSSYVFREEFDPPIHFKHEDFPVARAVMASSSVPFAFTPIAIDKKFYQHADDYDRIRPVLVDGGVYDNQGIQKITQQNSTYECDVVIVSDAGGNFIADKKYPNAVVLLLRTVNLFMYRIKTTQMIHHVYRNTQLEKRAIAYFSLGWEIERCIPGFVNNMIAGTVPEEVTASHEFAKDWIANPTMFRKEISDHLANRVDYKTIKERGLTKDEWDYARSTGTNLTKFNPKRIDCLIRHAENLTELQVKLYCPTLIN
ncbi:patatin-like phospholipase family protein [Lacibacter sp.]|uniref:patatin-like phospholipase family protein n=1 Tax=Lacibacter sp. TaxID=1915409 RepID=UPI002B4B3595|nr:patatin-like phospholipase family protein [Lacibacter sp.]HLP37743.1 patatin-like phospholipase family protein [Lacibacter sp.]